MFDWNDLRHFLAVARHGSTIAAGKALGVNQSTVHRRLSELEARIGRELVARHTAGYRVTEFGAELLPFAERVEAAVSELEQHVADGARDGRGTIRLTCPEPVVPRLLPLIDRFHARHPRFRVDLVTSDRYLDLLKGEADVAFRSGDTDDDLIGRKIADSIWAVYASRAYAERHGTPKRVEDLADHLLVSLDEKMASHRAVQWLQAVAPNARIASRMTASWASSTPSSRAPALVRFPPPSPTARQTSYGCWGRSRSWRGAGACSPIPICGARRAYRRSSTSSSRSVRP